MSRLTSNCPPVGRNQWTEELYRAAPTWRSSQQQPQHLTSVRSLPYRHCCHLNYHKKITTVITTSFPTTATTTAVTSSPSTIIIPAASATLTSPSPTPIPPLTLLPSGHHQSSPSSPSPPHFPLTTICITKHLLRSTDSRRPTP